MPDSSEGKKLHILFVDDDRTIRRTQAESLRAKGYSVTECNDGLEALATISEHKPDVLITGIKMPNMGGFELLERLKQDPTLAKIPVFVFSHRGDPADREHARNLGVADFLVHGFATPNEIAERIERLVAQEKVSYRLVLNLTALDGPKFREDFPAIVPPGENVTAVVEPESGQSCDAFRLRFKP